MDWDKLRIFHAVAEAGSFTHAGDRLSLSQSAVSRQISALEEVLHVPLFHRHARGLILTEQGEVLHRTVKEVFSKLALTQAFLSESKEKAAGNITITTTTGFGLFWLAPRLEKFLEIYPNINVKLLLDDTDLDLGMREADVAIRLHPPIQPDLVQRHLANFPMSIYASQSYIDKHGKPETLEELSHHHIIGFSGFNLPLPNINWLAELLKKETSTFKECRLLANNISAITSAIASGAGIGSLPLYAATNKQLIQLNIPEISCPLVEAFFVYPYELRTSKRIAVFRDFLLNEINSFKDKNEP
ncbi:LysR family transcriptional regulator [Swingsia samuiensis]|uniref:LysR family transcriptional regulator n=1 Tax=Swingsia samuiensis TaxID=1293412 RepID=A0A4Y6UMM9_9PROT|nr:LysR family transcriptional regulator [Swingsia samuiensis]QDH17928.1 LysR family transcriptional regulator [Swingsia samuiensis]